MLYIRASHILPIHYLHDTSITPHPSHRGGRRGKLLYILQLITARTVPLYYIYPYASNCQDLICYTYMRATYYVCTTYMIPAGFTTCMPIQSICNLLLPIQYVYSSHVITSYSEDFICYTYVLAMCYLYTTLAC